MKTKQKKEKERKIKVNQMNTGKKDPVSLVISIAVTLVLGAVMYYFLHPAVSLKSQGLWVLAIFLLVIELSVYCLTSMIRNQSVNLKVHGWILPIVIVVWLIMNLLSSRIFNARKYSEILTVSEDTVESIPSVEASGSIALMDTASAEMLGDRKIGSLSTVVSQYNVGAYTQINVNDEPVKTAPLTYGGFFKWRTSRDAGIPGYVMVNPVDMSAEYIPFETGLKYVPSACFSENLSRRLRFAYPSYLFSSIHFEVDDSGNPYYIASVMDHTIGLFGGTTVKGAVITDPISGEMTYYEAGSIPEWVDVVYEGDLICDQYNDHAQLQHGFLNSIFAQKDCRQVTTMSSSDEDDDSSYPDYGYIAKDSDIWIYTGVTSVNGDSSNIGFILANERTGETKYIPCAGADEFSAMRAAEGEVQEKRYTASFPSLININDSLTYIMVLKDSSGLVKQYAAVNVEQYNNVVTADSQKACIEQYAKRYTSKASSETETKTVTIKKIQTVSIDGNSWIYLLDTEDNIYRALFTDVVEILLYDENDTITIETDGDVFSIK